MGVRVFSLKLSTTVEDFDLRIDPKFYEKIADDFVLVENKKYEMIELRQILRPSYHKFNFEDGKKYKGLLTSADFFDEEGNILDYIDITKEDHPKRIKFEVRIGDIVISSLKWANVKTLLIDKEKTKYIWSDGFYIFEKSSHKFENEYLFYVLKSTKLRNILDDRLSRGIGISAYTERDLLRLKIPKIPIDVQQQALKQIREIEEQITRLKQTIPEVQELIGKIIENKLNISAFKELEDGKTKIFVKKFSDICKRRYLRCDPKYILFWGVTNGSVFKGKGKRTQLRHILQPIKPKIIKKGLLKKRMILINKEDVEAKTGIILNEDFVDKIDSDKIIFGDADILISKIDPFLGHVILNDSGKEIIGTTEFMPFTLKEKNDVHFIQFLLLSNAYLDTTRFILSGKRQPRLNSYDLLSLKVPYLDKIEQKEISTEIDTNIGDLKQKRETLRVYRDQIEAILMSSLSS